MFQVKGAVAVGDSIRVVLGNPAGVMVGSRNVGRLFDVAASATLSACINEGYKLVGEVTVVSDDGRAYAIVVGVR